MPPNLREAGLAALLVLFTACTPALPSALAPAATPSEVPAPPVQAEPLSTFAVQRLDANVGFVAGRRRPDGLLAKTSDAGATWHRLSQPASFMTALRFIDDRVGWALAFFDRDVPQIACQQAPPVPSRSCRSSVLRTGDGGQTWQETLSSETNGILGHPIRQLQAVDGQRAWVLVRADSCAIPCPIDLRRTTDGGKTWSGLLYDRIAAMRFASANRGWLAITGQDGAVEIRMTSNGGTTWTTGFRAQGTQFVSLDAATTQRAWVMTSDGASCTSGNCDKYELFRTDDGGMTWSLLGNPKDSMGGCGFGQLGNLLFASPERGWLTLDTSAGAVKLPGGLLTTEDGGKTWRCASTPPNTTILSAADPLHAWVISRTGVSELYATEDGGRSWRPLDLSRIP